jgi:1-acyl-sn-glycerol-3-phosphate acyltransferase
MKRALKLILILLNTFLSISALALVKFIFCYAPRRKLRYAYRVNYLFNKIFVFILGVKISLSGEKEILKSKGVFFVSNHLSYIDGIAISSLVPLVFIGRSDLRSWPIFGILSSLSYTIFVDRISPSNIHNEIEKITSFLNSGINVILFPEGTSTDGSKLLPFKSSFFTVAVHTECPVVPLAVRYTKIDSKEISERNKDLVYWYGEMDFIPHLFKVLGLNKIELEIKICKPIDVLRLEGKTPSLQRKYLSNASREAIRQHLS